MMRRPTTVATTTVDGQGSTGTEIAGNNAVVNRDGELDVSGGGHGIDITGDSATVDNKGGDRRGCGFDWHSDRRRQGGRQQRR